MFYVAIGILLLFCWMIFSQVVQVENRIKDIEYNQSEKLNKLVESIDYLIDENNELKSLLYDVSREVDSLKPQKNYLDY